MSKFSRSLTTAFLGAAVCLGLSSCSNQNKTTEVLQKMNYTVVEYEGVDLFAGGDDDYADKYKVVPPGGKDTIEVVVSGDYWGKAPTIRVK
ncbi:MAG: hypothetical protein HY052_08770 [Proteobacteria bacterium]|nr:hypothetical protein [Pseudomonadota bacterium]